MAHRSRQTASGLTVEISASRRFRGLCRRTLTGATRRACRLLGVERGEIGIHLADDAEIAQLHRRYKGQEGPTDVLTFDLSGASPDGVLSAGAPTLMVQIVIGAEVARREAKARRIAAGTEAVLYVVHGLLHCLGEDDHDQAAARRMRRRQEAVLRALGMSPAAGRTKGRATPRRRL